MAFDLESVWTGPADDSIRRCVAEIERLNGVIAQHDLCHDLHGVVDAAAFAKGCTAEQRKIYGCAPDADLLARYEAACGPIEVAEENAAMNAAATADAMSPVQPNRGADQWKK